MANEHYDRKLGQIHWCSHTRNHKYTMSPWALWLPSSHGTIVSGHLYLSFAHPKRPSFIALHNAWSPILASIFAGNGIVLKCSENVIWSSTWFVGAIQECLRACGHDPDLVQVSSSCSFLNGTVLTSTIHSWFVAGPNKRMH